MRDEDVRFALRTIQAVVEDRKRLLLKIRKSVSIGWMIFWIMIAIVTGIGVGKWL